MPPNRHYILGKGELLTETVVIPHGGDEGRHPYTMPDAKRFLTPKMAAVAEELDRLPRGACPNDEAVAILTLHPKYLPKSSYPEKFFEATGLRPVGSRPATVTPRKWTKEGPPEPCASSELFVAGPREAFRQLPRSIKRWTVASLGGRDLVKIEDFRVASPRDRIRGIDLESPTSSEEKAILLEVVLHAGEDGADILEAFRLYLERRLRLTVDLGRRIDIDGLSFVPVHAPRSLVEDVAAFAFVRVVREMPRLRQPTCGDLLGQHGTFPCKLPTEGPIDPTISVAVFDGGISVAPALKPWVNLCEPEGIGPPVKEYQQHGLGVTSALLFGSLTRQDRSPRPYAMIDHYRVLDQETAKDPQGELYPVLRRIFSVLRKGVYEYAVVCVGPYIPVDDEEVHPWTVLMDKATAGGTTFLAVAAGNTGERDAELGLNRIQPPADALNGYSVGASTRPESFWCLRAPYSSVGPGRSPGRTKPDGLAFGGTEESPFWVLAPSKTPRGFPTMGTSFAAPEALRAGLGVRAHIGPEVTPLAMRAILTHKSELGELCRTECGWGLICTDVEKLITCVGGVTHVLYKGLLQPKKYLRAPIPVPQAPLEGPVSLTATICIATDVDPQDPVHYTRSGVDIVFRPDKDNTATGKRTAPSAGFFGFRDGMTEVELRDDAHKWETTHHATQTFQGQRLKSPVFDLHYNPRREGRDAKNAKEIPYAMIVSIHAPQVDDLFDRIWDKYRFILQELRPRIELPIRT